MKRNRRTIAFLLILCMLLSLLSGCSTPESAKKGKTREGKSNSVTLTPVPTDEPTATPTLEPTAEPTATPTVTPAGKPWSTPAVDIPVYNEEQEKFDSFLNEIVLELVDGYGISLHFSFEYPEQFGIEPQNNFGAADSDYDAYIEFCQKYRPRMAGFDYDQLTPGQQVNYKRLMYEFEIGMQLAGINTDTYCGLYSVNNNVINSISTLLTEYPFINEFDVENFFETLNDFPRFMKEVRELAKKAYLENNCLLTEDMLDTTIENIDGITVKEDNPLIAGFAANLKELNLTDSQYNAFVKTYQSKLEEMVFAPLAEMREEVEGMYDSVDETPYGMCALPGGKEYFEYMLQTSVGTNMSVDEMYDYLYDKADEEYQNAVKLIRFHMDVYDNYPYGGYTETDPEVMLDALKEYIKQDYPAIRETKYTVSELPEALRVDGILAYFMTPQYDNGSRKIIRFNPDSVDEDDCASFFSTLAHEGYPGHLYQTEYFSHCEGYHALNALLSYTGYMEGWAVIAGQNAYSYIIDDPNLAEFYAIDYNLSMDLASVVAIGVHAKGWTVSDVEDYLSKYSMDPYAEYFYDTVLPDPAVYLPYTLGRYLMLDTFDKLYAKGYTDMEAKTAVLNVGPASYEVLWEALGVR